VQIDYQQTQLSCLRVVAHGIESGIHKPWTCSDSWHTVPGMWVSKMGFSIYKDRRELNKARISNKKFLFTYEKSIRVCLVGGE